LGIGLLSAVVVVPLETVYNGETAKYYNWSSIQANQKTGWLRALLSWWMAYWMESTDVVGSWRKLEWGGGTETNVGGGEGGGGGPNGREFLVCLFLSCVFAVFVNVASVAIINRSTAVSYQVLGQSKTVGVVFSSLTSRLNWEADQQQHMVLQFVWERRLRQPKLTAATTSCALVLKIVADITSWVPSKKEQRQNVHWKKRLVSTLAIFLAPLPKCLVVPRENFVPLKNAWTD
jgi:hypothetical protein